AASTSVFASSVHCGGALAGPIRHRRFGGIEGRQARAAGMGLAPIPRRQAQRAAPQARRREWIEAEWP
ncbi:hypothetical protein, partial [Ralstonia sp. OTU4908]|uniref:hypothetical protein n=1 Tax=Ralstonia sp. OTU4908 TaxID=3043851 RepID=UPI00313C8314